MEEDEPEYSKISKVGPMFKIEGGDIFLSPFQSFPLIGYVESEVLKDEEPFIQSIKSISTGWFEKFPDCCPTHKKLKHFTNFKKEDYDYIPTQILNNTKYFAHAIEIFIDKKDWLIELTDYMEFLIESLGNPRIGGHIFDNALRGLIEGVKINGKEFTDDQRLELLQHLEPLKPPEDLDERDIDVLFETFQKWVVAIPNVGGFKEFKERFKGKIPMNLFLIEPRFNKYLGISKYRSRSRNELLDFLFDITNDIIKISRDEINKENYDKNSLLIAAVERLRIKQDKLQIKGDSDIEVAYLELIENWLSIVIEFYQVLNQIVADNNNSKLSIDIKAAIENLNDVVSQLDKIKIEISTLSNSQKLIKWIDENFKDDSFSAILEEIDKSDDGNEENIKLLDLIKHQFHTNSNSHIKADRIESKMNDSEISVKHKLKLSIPIFLFTRYESEIELSNKQKLPTSLKELISLLIK